MNNKYNFVKMKNFISMQEHYKETAYKLGENFYKGKS